MIRFAVIGTNWITQRFIDAAHATGKMQLTAVYSRHLAQAYTFGEPNKAQYFSTRSTISEAVSMLMRSILPAQTLSITHTRWQCYSIKTRYL